jgi:mono/diheme cytochrome c family protein
MKRNIIIASLVVVLMSSCGEEKQKPNKNAENSDPKIAMKNGETIFNTNCAMCHSINQEGSTGMAPVLDSVKYHWPDKVALGKYLRNAKENLNTNEYTTALYEKWKDKVQMPIYAGLSDYDVESLIAYLNYVSK